MMEGMLMIIGLGVSGFLLGFFIVGPVVERWIRNSRDK